MGRIRVCHFSSVHHVWDTRVFYRECVSLAKEYEVTLIAIGSGSTHDHGVKVIGVKKASNPFFRILFTTLKVFILAVKEDASVYHIHDAEMIPFGIALRILGKQVIYDIHENTAGDILLKYWIPATLRKMIARCYQVLLYAGNYFMHYIPVIADERFARLFFVRKGQYTVIQNFASLKELADYRLENRWELPGNRIFYLGMIEDMYYNIKPVLEAMYLLKQKGLLLELELVGYFGTGSFEELKQLPFWNEISSQVHYHGFKTLHEAYAISKTCKLGICIKNQPQEMLVSHERKWFEYLSIGLPSLFCDAEIYTQTQQKCGKTGFPVNLNSARDIALKAELIISDPILQRQMAENAMRLANEFFNWEQNEILLINLYQKLLSA